MNASSSKSPWRGVHPARRTRGLNSLYSRPQLEMVLQRERARADRNSTEFSLILFRVRAEDRLLADRFQEAFAAYRSHTRAYIPFVR